MTSLKYHGRIQWFAVQYRCTKGNRRLSLVRCSTHLKDRRSRLGCGAALCSCSGREVALARLAKRAEWWAPDSRASTVDVTSATVKFISVRGRKRPASSIVLEYLQW